MLPNAYYIPINGRGRHHKPTPIEYLCDLWSKGPYDLLWQCSSTSNTQHTQCNDSNKKVRTSIALAREGILWKACHILTSLGLAPNTNDTWEFLHTVQTHQRASPGPFSRCHYSFGDYCPNDFNIMAILRPFPKIKACGPSGLHFQHLLDAVEVPLQFPICSSLRDLVNLLASGKVAVLVSKYLAGVSLTFLMKDMQS